MSKKWILAVVLASVVGLLAAATFRKVEARAVQREWPANFAHRGASIRAPENTLEAFRRAIKDGAGGLELDVHMTRDGRVVVMHDDTVDRTTDGSGAVRDMTLDEIRALDAGYRFSPDGGLARPYRGRGAGVPTLAEVYRNFPDARVNIDIKEDQPGVEEAVARVIEDAAAEDRTIVASGIDRVIKRFRVVTGAKIPTAASRREIEWFLLFSRLRLESLLRPEYVALQVPAQYRGITIVTPRFLAAARNRGVWVDVWTINDPSEMRRLLDLGADAIMTKRPEELAKILDERRSRSSSR